MIIFGQATGGVGYVVDDQPIVQGSNGVDSIYFCVPSTSAFTQVEVYFTLPNGQQLGPYLMEQGAVIPYDDTTDLYGFAYILPQAITNYSGTLQVSCNMIVGESENTTTVVANVEISESAMPVLPDAPTTDVYTQILAALSNLSGRMTNAETAINTTIPALILADITTHNTDATAHPAIIGTGGIIDTKIATHNNSSTAHADIRSDISTVNSRVTTVAATLQANINTVESSLSEDIAEVAAAAANAQAAADSVVDIAQAAQDTADAAQTTANAAEVTANTANTNVEELLASVGEANGIASLGSDGKVPASQLPSYVDDIIQVWEISGNIPLSSSWFSATNGGLTPITPETTKIYVDQTSGTYYQHAFRWDGNIYVDMEHPDLAAYLKKDGTVLLDSTYIPTSSLGLVSKGYVDTAVSAETNARRAADTTLTDNLAAEITNREAADAQLLKESNGYNISTSHSAYSPQYGNIWADTDYIISLLDGFTYTTAGTCDMLISAEAKIVAYNAAPITNTSNTARIIASIDIINSRAVILWSDKVGTITFGSYSGTTTAIGWNYNSITVDGVLSLIVNSVTGQLLTWSGTTVTLAYDTKLVGLISSTQFRNDIRFTVDYTQNKIAVEAAARAADVTQLEAEIASSSGVMTQVDMNGTLTSGVITFTLDSTITTLTFTNNTEYVFHLSLPLTTITGDLPNSYTMVLQDSVGNTVNVLCITQQNGGVTSTVGDMCELQNYNASTGYSWYFRAIYKSYTENSTTYRTIYVYDITHESAQAMTGLDFYNGITNAILKAGTVVLCTSTYGTSYYQGHTYLITSSWSAGGLVLSAKDITSNYVFSNLTLLAEAWSADTTYADYPYKYTLSFAGAMTITSNDVPLVNPDLATIELGILAPVALASNGTLTLYASEIPSDNIIIPSIVIIKG